MINKLISIRSYNEYLPEWEKFTNEMNGTYFLENLQFTKTPIVEINDKSNKYKIKYELRIHNNNKRVLTKISCLIRNPSGFMFSINQKNKIVEIIKKVFKKETLNIFSSNYIIKTNYKNYPDFLSLEPILLKISNEIECREIHIESMSALPKEMDMLTIYLNYIVSDKAILLKGYDLINEIIYRLKI